MKPFKDPNWPLIGMPFSEETMAPLLQFPEDAQVDSFAGLRIREYPKNGTAVYVDELGKIVNLFFYGVMENGEHEKYQGHLPQGLTFADGMQDVLARFGEPSRTGKEKSTGAPWVRYDYPDHCLHIRFSDDGNAIHQVGLRPADTERV